MSRPDLAKKVGVSHVTIGKWEDLASGDLVKISHENMVKLADALNRPAEWIQNGGYIPPVGTVNFALGRRRRPLEDPFPSEVREVDYLAPSLWGDGEPDYSQSLRVVPVISWVAAGAFDEAHDPHAVGDAETWLPCPKKSFGPHTYALRVRGDSMTSPHGRTYPEGSTIFVDPDLRSPANGERIIAKLEGTDEVTFKCFQQDAGRVWLKPLNPQHPPIMEPFKVLGTVIGTWIGE